MIYAWVFLPSICFPYISRRGPICKLYICSLHVTFYKALTSGQDKLPSGTCLTFHLSRARLTPGGVPFPSLPASVARFALASFLKRLYHPPQPQVTQLHPLLSANLCHEQFLPQKPVPYVSASGPTVPGSDGTILNPRRKVIFLGFRH